MSKEDILDKYETYVTHSDIPIYLKENVLKAMEEYSQRNLRQYYIGLAMSAVEEPKFYVGEKETKESLSKWAKRCSQIADALINELNKDK